MNKEQIKHWVDVLRDIAIGQFMFAGGKNLYLYTKNDFDLAVLIIAGVVYLLLHVIIHFILSTLED